MAVSIPSLQFRKPDPGPAGLKAGRTVDGRCRPEACSSAIGVGFGARQPTARTACVGCAASANSPAPTSSKWFSSASQA